MGLKRLLSALLPEDARESILGDLEERGFPFLDCATAILAARWAALRREWWGPVPNLAGASEEAVRRRIAQLTRIRWIGLSWMLVTLGAHILQGIRPGPAPRLLFGCFVIILVLGRILGFSTAASGTEPGVSLFANPNLPRAYRRELGLQAAALGLSPIGFTSVARSLGLSQWQGLAALAAVSALILTRVLRLRMELYNLPTEAKHP